MPRQRLVQRRARLGFAAAAAIRAAGAGLQVTERAHAIGDGALDVVGGDRVAQTDVHVRYHNANANDCQPVGDEPADALQVSAAVNRVAVALNLVIGT